MDGSDTNLPTNKNDFVYCVNQARNNNYFYQVHVNTLYDICENCYVTAFTKPRPAINENKTFLQMVDSILLPENTIFIADRGYVSLNSIAHLLDSKKYFLIRVKCPSSKASLLKHLLEDDVETDKMISFGVTRAIKNKYTSNPSQYKVVTCNRTFTLISVDDRIKIFNMNIRCTCIKLADNQYEYLVSNLPMNVFSKEDLAELYWKRRSLETSFRSLKYVLSLVYLHSIKNNNIFIFNNTNVMGNLVCSSNRSDSFRKGFITFRFFNRVSGLNKCRCIFEYGKNVYHINSSNTR